MKTKTTLWDAAEHLKTKEDMAAYLACAFEEGDAALMCPARRNRRIIESRPQTRECLRYTYMRGIMCMKGGSGHDANQCGSG